MTLFEKSRPGRKAFHLPETDIPSITLPFQRESELRLPEVGEVDVIRHYTNLSKKIYSIDSGFYPLGSCTMKYNPKVNEDVASMPGFSQIHPLQPIETVQGCLEVFDTAQRYLSEITGMDRITFQPAAGAQGELTSLLMIKAYHQANGDTQRKVVIVPDSAHGTNPASASMAGFDVIEVPSKDGNVDLEALRLLVDDTIAAIMLTNPNTLGLFENDILEIADIIHNHGGLMYCDGANMNAIMGISRPGDMGFDVIHLNLHKTFSTPHGGGGPGSGVVGVKDILAPFLPEPNFQEGAILHSSGQSIGPVKQFYGNYLVVVRALTYMMSLGGNGLKKSSQHAVLNANYLYEKMKDNYQLAIAKPFMHEFVLSVEKMKKETGVSALDVSKSLIDFGIHPPTMYFPIIVHEALMVEPTETENIDTLNQVAEAFNAIAAMSQSEPQTLKTAPHTAAIKRVDEVKAARHPILSYQFETE